MILGMNLRQIVSTTISVKHNVWVGMKDIFLLACVFLILHLDNLFGFLQNIFNKFWYVSAGGLLSILWRRRSITLENHKIPTRNATLWLWGVGQDFYPSQQSRRLALPLYLAYYAHLIN